MKIPDYCSQLKLKKNGIIANENRIGKLKIAIQKFVTPTETTFLNAMLTSATYTRYLKIYVNHSRDSNYYTYNYVFGGSNSSTC